MTNKLLAVFCPIAYASESNDFFEAQECGPDNLAINLSSTGEVPVTHLGCSGVFDQGVVDALALFDGHMTYATADDVFDNTLFRTLIADNNLIMVLDEEPSATSEGE